LVKSVVEWDFPNEWAKNLFAVHGRSIVFKSPTRTGCIDDYLEGRFDGLQLVGVGGSLYYVRSGMVERPGILVIDQPDPKNHAEMLSDITELRDFDNEGKIVFSNRKYVPLRGMDLGEAQNRKRFTAIVRGMVEKFRQENIRLPFVAPEIAAEGYFPKKIDDGNTPLQFQVYRVPIIPRFPSQTTDRFYQGGDVRDMLDLIGFVTHKMGKVLRSFHANDLAYMDSHLGNISLISNNKSDAIYTTDLGSMKEFSNEKFPRRYMGFDAYSFLFSAMKHTEAILNFFQSKILVNGAEIEDRKIALLHLANSYIDSFLNGYFRPEIAQNTDESKTLSHRIKREYSPYLALLLHGNMIQKFVEHFEIISPRNRAIAGFYAS